MKRKYIEHRSKVGMYAVKAYAAAIIGNKELYRRNRPIDETRYVGTLSAGTSKNLPTSLPKGAFRETWFERLSKLHHD